MDDDDVESVSADTSDLGVMPLFVDAGVQCDLVQTEVADLKMECDQLNKELVNVHSELYQLREKYAEAENNRKFSFQRVQNNAAHFQFICGITVSVFLWIVSLLGPKLKLVRSTLSFEDHLLVVLMKLKLGLSNKDIAYRFEIPQVSVSKIIRKWLPVMSKSLGPLIIWPSKSAVKQHMPRCFQKKFRNCRRIIDCCEIFIERAKNLTARAQTWSNYKHHNTIKFLVGITPAGAVGFLSKGWGGRASDNKITLESGFLDKVEHGDCILADRGFQIKEELAVMGATLSVPSFTKGKSQLPAKDVHASRCLSNVRIHVERVIGRLKTFKILQTTIPISQVDLLDDIVTVYSALVNLNKSVVSQ